MPEMRFSMQSLGIDLAKASFDVTLLTTAGQPAHQQFPNTPVGFAQLERWLKRQKVSHLHACMEATNVYWEALALFLHQRGHTVSVVNPARIKGYAMSQMQRNKTDKQDSATIAAFCAAHELEPWTPPTAAQRTLRALVRHRDDLIATRIQQTNRLQDTTEPAVRTSLESLIALLKAQLKSIQQQITAHLKANPELAEQHRLMDSVPGIGPVTAQKLLAEFYDLASYPSAKAAAADAGLTAANYESGSTVRRRPRMSKLGKAGIRGGLYWPAITVLTHAPEFKAYAARLAARGKSKAVILGAVMRKLVHILYGVVKHKTPYDRTKVLG
jgi:transposase